jgi:hypothetical protein
MMMNVMNTVRNYAMTDVREREMDGVIQRKRRKRKRSNVELAWTTLWKEMNAKCHTR